MPWPSGPFPIPVSRVNIRPWFSGQTKHINKDDSASRKRWPLGSEETQSPQPSLAASQSEGALPLPSYISLYISRSWGADKEPRGSPSAAPMQKVEQRAPVSLVLWQCPVRRWQHQTNDTACHLSNPRPVIQTTKSKVSRCWGAETGREAVDPVSHISWP